MLALFAFVTFGSIGFAYKISQPSSLVKGIIWQPSFDYSKPAGNWHLLGASTLLVQWLIVDNHAWLDFSDHALASGLDQGPTEWLVVFGQPWARNVIWGLAGRFNVQESHDMSEIISAQSQFLIDFVPSQPLAWYAPLEVSPELTSSDELNAYLDRLPRPLMISVYGGHDMTPERFAAWVHHVLPSDIFILIQDEVGVQRQSPQIARQRVENLAALRGSENVGIILEAFVQKGAYGEPDLAFEPSSVWRVYQQLSAYKGLSIYVFSARYLSPWRVIVLKMLIVLFGEGGRV